MGQLAGDGHEWALQLVKGMAGLLEPLDGDSAE
jgi:hypothetical protein